MFTKISALLALMATLNGVPAEEHSIYVQVMEVEYVSYEEGIVTCLDAEGFEWDFYGCDGFMEGDHVACLMDTMGTEDDIFDDAILDVYLIENFWVE